MRLASRLSRLAADWLDLFEIFMLYVRFSIFPCVSGAVTMTTQVNEDERQCYLDDVIRLLWNYNSKFLGLRLFKHSGYALGSIHNRTNR